MDGSQFFDPTRTAQVLNAVTQQMNAKFRQEQSAKNIAYENSQLERAVGACEAVMTSAPDPDQRRFRSEALWGYRPVIKTPAGGGDAMVEVVSDNNDANFSIPGSPLIAQRAHANAGGVMACQSGVTNNLAPRITPTGGGCAGPVQNRVEQKIGWEIRAIPNTEPPGSNNWVALGRIITTNACLESYMTTFKAAHPTYRQFNPVGINDGSCSASNTAEYDCGG